MARRGVVGSLVLLALLVGAAVAEFKKPADPSAEHRHKVAKGRASAEIVWDSWGVPHIWADNNVVLSYAYGYAQGRDHGEMLMRFIGEARGRAAEYWGESYRALDIYTWSSGTVQYATDLYLKQHPESVAQCEAFAEGFMQYMADHPDEYADNKYAAVLPIDGLDVFKHGLRVYFTFSYGGASGISAEFLAEFPGADAFRAKYETDKVHYSAFMDHETPWKDVPKQFRSLIGSNGWAIGAPKTASGGTMLDMNPHLPYEGFFRWYEAHFIIASEGVDLRGCGFVGLPNLQIGFNDYVGWTHTVNTIQPYTVYKLRLASDFVYYYDNAQLTLTNEEFPFKVLLEDGSYSEEVVIVESSIHGPVYGRGDGYALVARYAGLDRADPIKEWWDMGRSRSMAEFIGNLQQLQISMFSIIAASADGHIYHGFNGYVPVRHEGDWAYWKRPAPGDNSSFLWDEIHPYHELPQIIDPVEGWLSNANEPPWTTTFPLYQPGMNPGDYPPYTAPNPNMGYRPQVAARHLYENHNITFEKFVELKHSTLFEFAYKAVDELIAAIETYAPNDRDMRIVADLFRNWDRHYDADTTGSLIFEHFERVQPGSSIWLNPWSDKDPLGTPNTLRDPAGAVELLREAVRLMRARGLALDAPYHTIHQFYGSTRFTQEPVVYPGHGNSETFRNVWWFGETPGTLGGDSFVGIIEYPPNGRVYGGTCIGYGQASPRSRGALVFGHVNDQYGLFADKALKTVFWDYADVVADKEDGVILSF